MKTIVSRLVPTSLLLAALAVSVHGCGNSGGSSSDCPIVVTSFTPASGRVGDTVTITGSELGGADAKVGFSGAEATVLTGSTDTTLIVLVPIGAQTAPLTVDVPSRQNCQASSDDVFTVTP
jgi:hypothetical protein